MSIYLTNTPGMIEYELGNDDNPPPIDNTNRRPCLEALARLFEQGSGKEETSCMSCEPSRPICSDAGDLPCQVLIDFVYAACGNHGWQVCMPDDFYFDQNFNIKAKCWSDAKPAIKVAVERCGCSGAAGRAPGLIGSAAAVLVAMVLLLRGPRAW